MHWLFSSYTLRLNHRHKLFGHVFSGRYKSISQEMKRLGWTETELERRYKSGPGKLALAARLRRETTLPMKWIAGRVRLGTWKSARTRLQTWRKAHEEKNDTQQMAMC
jgi:hypothetical protein